MEALRAQIRMYLLVEELDIKNAGIDDARMTK
jgi:hypothetical protein